MRPDLITINKHHADAIQADAELKRLNAELHKDAAKQKLDDELGLSRKRKEFQERLSEVRQASKDD